MQTQSKSKRVPAKRIAEEVGVTAKTITNLANKGQIPHLRIGKSLRFDLEECLKTFQR